MVALPLAGCLTAQATAFEHRDTARSRADDWDPSAELAGALGVEGRPDDVPNPWHSAASELDIPWARAEDDPTAGDGRYEFWAYAYVAEGRDEGFFVVVDRDGQVLDSGTAGVSDHVRPVGEVSVDSDRAMEIAREENEAIRDAARSDDATVIQSLGREEDADHARWLVGGGPGDAKTTGGVVTLDAVTGEVLSSETFGGEG